MYSILFVIVNAILYYGVSANPDGANTEACEDMTPKGPHDNVIQPQNTSPYSVKVNESYFNASEKIMVTIQSTGGAVMNGIMIRAREKGTGKVVGSFSDLPGKTKFLPCRKLQDNQTVTHSERLKQTDNITVTWNAPDHVKYLGNVSFFATVVQNTTMFWVGLESPELHNEGYVGMPNKDTGGTDMGGKNDKGMSTGGIVPTTTTPNGAVPAVQTYGVLVPFLLLYAYLFQFS